MPWQLAAGSFERFLALASAASVGLGGVSLLNRVQSKAAAPAAPAESPAGYKQSLFSANDFAQIQKTCKRGDFETATAYGTWHKTKHCLLPPRGDRPVDLPIDSILYSDTNKVIGFKRMLVTEKRRAFFDGTYNLSAQLENDNCSKFGQGGYPILIVTKKQLCDALALDQV